MGSNKILYSGCTLDPWIDVAKNLAESGMEPEYWIYWDNEGELKVLKKTFPAITIHRFSDAWRGNFPDEMDGKKLGNAIITPEIYQDIQGELLQGISMMDRQDPTGNSFSFYERRRHFIDLIRKWLFILKEREINVVISGNIPHRVFDYALYISARLLDIQFISFKMTPWPGVLIPVSEVNSKQKFIKETDDGIEKEVFNYVNRLSKSYEDAEPEYMEKQRRDKEKIEKKTFSPNKILDYKLPLKIVKKVQGLLGESSIYWKKNNTSLSESRFTNLEKMIEDRKGRRYKQKLLNKYKSHTVKVKNSGSYVFVALHYQPEATTSPSGGIFVDQELMVQALLDYFPSDVQLYVKEHPSQFHPTMEGEAGRSMDFYERLDTYERIKLVSINKDPFSLIDNSLAVATVTGTVGIESIVRGKPAIYFGSPWYQGIEGSFDHNVLRDIEDPFLHLENYKIDQHLVEGQLNYLYKNSVKAYHYPGVKEKSNITRDESIENLTTFLSDYLVSSFN